MKPPVEGYAPGSSPFVDWQRAWESEPKPKKRFDCRPVSARMPTKRGYVFPSPTPGMVGGEIKAVRAKVRSAMEYLMFSESATDALRAKIRRWLGELSRIENAKPHTTNVAVCRTGSTAIVHVHEPELAPIGECPRITVPWTERFKI